MWESLVPAGEVPPLSPWPQPWHPILAQASPRPNIPLRSGPACKLPLPLQVRVVGFRHGLPLLLSRPLSASEKGPFLQHPLCNDASPLRFQG